jgi:hypothetical protein
VSFHWLHHIMSSFILCGENESYENGEKLVCWAENWNIESCEPRIGEWHFTTCII